MLIIRHKEIYIFLMNKEKYKKIAIQRDFCDNEIFSVSK